MRWLASVKVPGTDVYLPSLEDLGLTDKELYGMGIILLVPILGGICAVCIATWSRNPRKGYRKTRR